MITLSTLPTNIFGHLSNRRRRKCEMCGERQTTYEVYKQEITDLMEYKDKYHILKESIIQHQQLINNL